MKTGQAVQGQQAFVFCVVKVNSTVDFKHFEDQTSHYFEHLKETLVISCPLGSFYFKSYVFKKHGANSHD